MKKYFYRRNQIKEDAPVNSIGSGAIAGAGISPPDKPSNWGEPGVTKKQQKKRTRILRRKQPIMENEERHPPRSKNPDHQINVYRNVENVPISWLKKLPGNKFRHSDEEINKMSDDIKKNGLKEPLIVNVGKETRTAKLGEGNHRLEALRRAGYTHAPTRVTVGREWGKEHQHTHNLDHDLKPKPGEYFSSDSRPSEVFHSLSHLKEEEDNIASIAARAVTRIINIPKKEDLKITTPVATMGIRAEEAINEMDISSFPVSKNVEDRRNTKDSPIQDFTSKRLETMITPTLIKQKTPLDHENVQWYKRDDDGLPSNDAEQKNSENSTLAKAAGIRSLIKSIDEENINKRKMRKTWVKRIQLKKK